MIVVIRILIQNDTIIIMISLRFSLSSHIWIDLLLLITVMSLYTQPILFVTTCEKYTHLFCWMRYPDEREDLCSLLCRCIQIEISLAIIWKWYVSCLGLGCFVLSLHNCRHCCYKYIFSHTDTDCTAIRKLSV